MSPERPDSSCHVSTSAKPTAAAKVAPGKAAKALKSLHPIHWGSKAARAHPAQQQRTATRSHAWGVSLFPSAGRIPYSSKALNAAGLSEEGTKAGLNAQGASKEVGAKASGRHSAAQASEPESRPQPNVLSASQVPMPSAAPASSSDLAKTSSAPQQPLSEHGHSLRAKSGAERLQQHRLLPKAGTDSAAQNGCAPRLNQGFWQELQRVLSHLPDHRGAGSQPPAAANQLQGAIAAAADFRIPLARCHALACLATASFYRGAHNVPVADSTQSSGQAALAAAWQLPQQATQQTPQQMTEQAAQQAAESAAPPPAQQAAPQEAQQMPQQMSPQPAQPVLEAVPRHIPQLAAPPASVDTGQQSPNAQSALPEQAYGHVSMHAMLASARGPPKSPAAKQAPTSLNTVATSGMTGHDTPSSSAAEVGPRSDTAFHSRLEPGVPTTELPPVQGNGAHVTAPLPTRAQQQEGPHGNHTAVANDTWAEDSGALRQATAHGRHENMLPQHGGVAMSKPDAAPGQSQQSAAATVVAAAATGSGEASKAGPTMAPGTA